MNQNLLNFERARAKGDYATALRELELGIDREECPYALSTLATLHADVSGRVKKHAWWARVWGPRESHA